MHQFLSFLVLAVTVAVLFPHEGHGEVNKYGTALAADVWNSLSTREDLEAFLSAGKKKGEKAQIKKLLSGLKAKPKAAFVNRESIQFGSAPSKWALDSEGGVWLNGKLFVAKEGSSILDTLKQFEIWKKQNLKTSMFSLWVAPVYAQTASGLSAGDDAVYAAFMAEFGQLVNKPCLFQMGEDVLKKLAEKAPAGSPKPKITSMGIICSDQNPNKETIYAAASGPNVVIMMNGEYATSPSTSKTYLKKVKISMSGENRVNVNFIESPTGSDVHTMDVKYQEGGKFETLDKNQIQSKSTISCTAELAQRMVAAINTVCDNRPASGLVQKNFGQTSGPPPAKAAADAQGQQAK